MILDKLDTEIYTRPTTRFAGAADYPMRCARKAATLPNPAVGSLGKIEDDENMIENGLENGVKSLKI